jgi:hypothetical protein
MVSSTLQHRRKAFRSAGGSSFLLEEGFEGTGFENTWTTAGTGTVDPDEATTVIAGSQSLQFLLSGTNGSSYASFSAQASLFCKCRFRVASTNSGTQVFATIRSGTTVLATYTMVGASRVLRANAAGGANGTSSDAVPVDTDLYVWIEYQAGPGTLSVARIGWVAVEDYTEKPSLASTGAKAGVSTSTSAPAGTSADRLYLGNTGTGTMECFFDTVQVAATAF